MIVLFELIEDDLDIDKTKLELMSICEGGGSGKIIKKYYYKNCTSPVLTGVAR